MHKIAFCYYSSTIRLRSCCRWQTKNTSVERRARRRERERRGISSVCYLSIESHKEAAEQQQKKKQAKKMTINKVLHEIHTFIENEIQRWILNRDCWLKNIPDVSTK